MFQTSLLDYMASVSLLSASLSVTPMSTDPNAGIDIIDNAVISDVGSPETPLIEGDNTITITITTTDSISMQTYTLKAGAAYVW